jgi:hypothetical protein
MINRFILHKKNAFFILVGTLLGLLFKKKNSKINAFLILRLVMKIIAISES